MKTLQLRISVSLVTINKNVIRSISSNSSLVSDTVEATPNLKSWKQIPGPSSFPIIGPLLNFLPGGKWADYTGNLPALGRHFYKEYGPIVRFESMLGLPRMLWLFDADAADQLLRSENGMPFRPGLESLEYYRKYHNKTYDPNRQTGLATDHGEPWRDFRTKVNHIMLQPRTINLYEDTLDEVADDMIARIKSVRDENNMIKENFGTQVNLWALESVGIIGLGTRLNCFDPNLPEDSVVRKLVQNVHDFFTIMGKVDFEPSPWKYFATPTFKKAMKIYAEHERLAQHFIDDALKKLQESKKYDSKSNSEKPILEKLLEMDVKVAHIMASDMLVAGVDTVSNSVLGLLYFLAKNPEKQSKLRNTLLENKDNKAYLRACIKESMRIQPVVNGNSRLTTKEYNLLGYKIPKNFMIVIQHQVMSTLEQYYPMPEEFIPERWLVGKDDFLYHGNAHPYAHLPFGFGVRMCIGRRIAKLEIETFISKVIKNFHVEWEGPPPTVKFTTINTFTGPFNFVFKDL